jgi:hypothetical protein
MFPLTTTGFATGFIPAFFGKSISLPDKKFFDPVKEYPMIKKFVGNEYKFSGYKGRYVASDGRISMTIHYPYWYEKGASPLCEYTFFRIKKTKDQDLLGKVKKIYVCNVMTVSVTKPFKLTPSFTRGIIKTERNQKALHHTGSESSSSPGLFLHKGIPSPREYSLMPRFLRLKPSLP